MSQIDLEIPDDLRQFLATATAEAGMTTEGDYIRSLIREALRKRAELKLSAQLQEGREGPFTRMTDEEFDALEAEAIGELQRESVRP